ncbi:hypothetical protein AB0M28_20585 [Streptomyces sp. NPDC051940]|uniref:hypothetical protein n=1 Tax=Streptomyces sp. NPDC051940 TaxID=3155675 RepID=UPI003430A81D
MSGLWVSVRLAAMPGAAVVLGLLVAVTAALAAAFPRAVAGYEDRGLRRQIVDARPADATLRVERQTDFTELPADRAAALGPEQLAERRGKLAALLRAPLRIDASTQSYGVRTAPDVRLSDPGLPRPGILDPTVQLDARSGLTAHARVLEGRLPGPPAAGTALDKVTRLEAVVTPATAKTLGLHTGSVVHAQRLRPANVDPATLSFNDAHYEQMRAFGAPVAVHITGLVEPRDRDDAYWGVDPLLQAPRQVTRPVLVAGGQQWYWASGLMLDEGSAAAVDALWSRARVAPTTYYNYPLDTSRLTGADAGALLDRVTFLQSPAGPPVLAEAGGQGFAADSKLPQLLEGYVDLRAAVTPVVLVAAYALVTVAAVVLLMVGSLAWARRRGELVLLRARGGSLPAVTRRLAAEGAVVAVPAAAAGFAAAVLAVPSGTLAPALAAAAAVAVAAVLVVPARAWAALRPPVQAQRRTDLVTLRPSARRIVFEATGVALAVGALAALYRRGTSAGVDPLVSAAPVVAGMVLALVCVRLYPIPLRAAALPAAARRGIVGFLALARAGRSPQAAVLPLLAVLIAVSTAAFGGSVLAGVGEARDRLALLQVGADAVVSPVLPGQTALDNRGIRDDVPKPLPDEAADRVGRVPGVDIAVAVYRQPWLQLAGGEGVTLIVADSRQYAELSERLGLGAFPAGELHDRGVREPMAALISPAVAEAVDGRTFTLDAPHGELTLRPVLVREATPGWTGGSFVVVDAGVMARHHPATVGKPETRPTSVYVAGPGVRAGALRSAMASSPVPMEVRMRSAAREGLRDHPLQTGAERLYRTAVVAGTGFAVLAVVLSLVQAGPERRALMARLGTMGLAPAARRRLLLLEALPQLVLAGAAGTVLAVAAIRLLSTRIGLEAMASALHPESASPALAPTRLHPDPTALALPAVSVTALVTLVVLTQVWWSTRTPAEQMRAAEA